MARLTPIIIADENICKSCKDCVVDCPFGAIKPAPAPARPPVTALVPLEGRQLGNKCDLCFDRKQGPTCVAACPEKALRFVDPLQDKNEKNVKAARSIAGIRCNRYSESRP